MPLDRSGGMARGVCSFLSSALNWLKLRIDRVHNGQYKDQQVISAAWVSAMTQPAPRNPNSAFYLWLGPFNDSRLFSEVSGKSDPMKGQFLTSNVLFAEGSGGVRLYVCYPKNASSS